MIIHVDMDAFYASVEERENPALKGRPLIVGGQAGSRGVVAAANYAARKFGVFSAMPTSQAIRLCPDLIIIPPRGGFYSRVSRAIHDIFERYTPIIEPLSLDEAFLDPRGSERLHGDAMEIGQKIKNDIKDELNLVASVGVAPNKFLAKLASDHEKPDGFTVIRDAQVQSFLDALTVGKLWGVGKSAKEKLARYGIKTVADLRNQEVDFLDVLFGKSGEQLWQLAHGIDHRPVVTHGEAKSVSQETTFRQDIMEFSIVESELLDLTEGVGFRLRQGKLLGKTITVKVRFSDFKTITRSQTLGSSTNTTGEIWAVAQELLIKALPEKPFSVRLVGIGASGFDGSTGPQQTDLFSESQHSSQHSRQRDLDRLSDAIQNKYGKGIVRRGKSIIHSDAEPPAHKPPRTD